jgi:hypothetical protein
MTYYLNFKNNTVSLDETLDKNIELIEMDDFRVIVAIEMDDVNVAVDLDLFIEKEALKIMDIAKRCTTYDELRNFILGEGDFLELILEKEFNILLSDYSDVRDMQIEQFNCFGEKLILNT